MIEELIRHAKSWRGMTKLVLTVQSSEEQAGVVQHVAVDLGAARRRWKRVAATIEPMIDDVVGAAGYNESGEMVGSWVAPDDDDDDDEGPPESDEHAAHRAHTQWVLREAAKMHEGVTRLTIELVRAAIDIVSAVRPGAAAAAEQNQSQDDETAKTLGLILQSVMANNNRGGNDAGSEAERHQGSQGGYAGRQGSASEPPQADTGPPQR